jgi:hypothetical protein
MALEVVLTLEAKTHTRRGGRNRYVATLDETSPDYDPEFRGQLSFDGRPSWSRIFCADLLVVGKICP